MKHPSYDFICLQTYAILSRCYRSTDYLLNVWWKPKTEKILVQLEYRTSTIKIQKMESFCSINLYFRNSLKIWAVFIEYRNTFDVINWMLSQITKCLFKQQFRFMQIIMPHLATIFLKWIASATVTTFHPYFECNRHRLWDCIDFYIYCYKKSLLRYFIQNTT